MGVAPNQSTGREMPLKFRYMYAKSRCTASSFNLSLDVQFSRDGIQPSMLPLALECLPFGIIAQVHVQLYPLLEARNGISHVPLCFMQITLL